MEAEAGAVRSEGEGGWGYPGPAVAGAVLATLFFPLVSLIVSLIALGNERDDRKRRGLRTWAWSAGAMLLVQAVVAVAILVAVTSSSSGVDRSGPCVGGPDPNATGEDVSGSGKTFVIPCAISGTATVSFPGP